MKNLKDFCRFVGQEEGDSAVAEALTRRLVNRELDENFLHAARVGNIEDCKRLLSRGANINAQDEYGGQTALYLAVNNEHTEIESYLIEQGADPNLKDWEYDETPVKLAVDMDDHEALSAMIASERCSKETLKGAIEAARMENNRKCLIMLLWFCMEREMGLEEIFPGGEKALFDAVGGNIDWMPEGTIKDKFKRMQKVRNIFGK